jgi:hypothetical protein
MSATSSPHYRTPKQLCPHCGYLFDAIGALNSDAKTPKPGDASICLNCAEILMFLTPTMFRKPTESELRAIRDEPVWADVRRNQANLRKMMRQGFRTKAAQRGEGRPQ